MKKGKGRDLMARARQEGRVEGLEVARLEGGFATGTESPPGLVAKPLVAKDRRLKAEEWNQKSANWEGGWWREGHQASRHPAGRAAGLLGAEGAIGRGSRRNFCRPAPTASDPVDALSA
ncbi:hypothetical protein [Opitutus sp. ER46]|uniref:hypothetical protein n=1 Tax=Opitutus sp. ER46 TaxID=2161864 RepID=UPI0011B1F74A|nr:hypothetical protein [Opitutus sp. ER46]